MTDIVLTERDHTTTVLTLNRPEKLNALDGVLIERLSDAVDRATHSDCRLLVFRGAGKAFSAGFDFSELESQTDADLALRFLRLETLLQTIYHSPIATLALTQGACYGAAADLVCACHRTVATPDSRFRMPGLRFSVVLGTRRLTHKVGAAAAQHLLRTSRVFDADQALRWGFIHKVCDAQQWPQILAEEREASEVLPPHAQRHLFAHTLCDTRDADMASLARSVTAQGLKQRMQTYFENMKRDSRIGPFPENAPASRGSTGR